MQGPFEFVPDRTRQHHALQGGTHTSIFLQMIRLVNVNACSEHLRLIDDWILLLSEQFHRSRGVIQTRVSVLKRYHQHRTHVSYGGQ